jgi:uncharacterized Zn ribbon protein
MGRHLNTYPDAANYICPDCGHEWPQGADAAGADAADAGDGVVRDANGNPLNAIEAINDRFHGACEGIQSGQLPVLG